MSNDNSAPQLLVKKSVEVRKISMDFTNWVDKTVNISSPTITHNLVGGGGTSDLTISATSISGKKVTCLVGGGQTNQTYTVLFRINTSDGQTLEGDGSLRILDE